MPKTVEELIETLKQCMALSQSDVIAAELADGDPAIRH